MASIDGDEQSDGQNSRILKDMSNNTTNFISTSELLGRSASSMKNINETFIQDSKENQSATTVKEMQSIISKSLKNAAGTDNHGSARSIHQESREKINSQAKTPQKLVTSTESDFEFVDPKVFDYFLSLGPAKQSSNLRKESLYVKFDPLLKPVSNTNFKCDQTFTEVSERLISITEPINSNESAFSSSKNLKRVHDLISFSPRLAKADNSSQQMNYPELGYINDVCGLSANGSYTAMAEETELKILREKLKTQVETYEVLQEKRKQLENISNSNDLLAANTSVVVRDYEKAIENLITKKENENLQYNLEIEELYKERDCLFSELQSYNTHVQNAEQALSDVKIKYGYSRDILAKYSANDHILKSSVESCEKALQSQQEKFMEFMRNTEQSLQRINEELVMAPKLHEKELAILQGKLKKCELKICSLQSALENKAEEIEKLTLICDDLLNK